MLFQSTIKVNKCQLHWTKTEKKKKIQNHSHKAKEQQSKSWKKTEVIPHQYHLCIHHFYYNHLATCNHKTILSPIKGSSNEFPGMPCPYEQTSTNETGVLFGLNAQLSEPWLERTLRSPQGLGGNKLQLSTAEAALRCSLNWLPPLLHFFTSTSWDHLPQKPLRCRCPTRWNHLFGNQTWFYT